MFSIRLYIVFFCLLSCFYVGGCGPRDISQENSDYQVESRTSVSTAEQMRYPSFGSDANQRMLFLNNKMDVMTMRQNYINSQLKDPHHLSPANPKYRAIPKEPSPFRQ